MMVLKKKTIIIITLVVLIVAAGYISTKYGKVIKVNTNNEEQTEALGSTDAMETSKESTGYFIDVKIGRDNQRTLNKQTLKEIIDSENTSEEAKKDAEQKLLELVDISNKEMVMEALIKSKNFEDAVVLVTEDTVNVTVKGSDVTPEQVSQIKNIVCKETGIPASKVTIQFRE